MSLRGDVGSVRAALRGNVVWLSAVSFLNDTASEMIFPLLPIFLVTTLGAGPAFLGLVEGIAETTSSLVKLAGGWLSDRVGRRKVLVVWGYGLAACARPLVALATLPWHVLAMRFADRVGKGVRTAPRDALLADSVPPSRHGSAFGIHRAADHAGAVLGPLVAAGLLLVFPGDLRLVFALALVPGALAVALVLLKVRESRDSQPAAASPTGSGMTGPAERVEGAGKPAYRPAVPGPGPADGPARSRLFRRYLLVLVIFTLGNASDAFLLLRAEQLGVAVAALPLLWASLHVSKSAWNVVGGALGDRLGAARTIRAGWLVYAAVYTGFAVAGSAWHAWLLFVAYGLYYGLTEGPEKALVAGLSGVSRRATAFGAYHFSIGLAALPASVLFGLLWSVWGPGAAFAAGAVLALLAALLLGPWLPPSAEPAEAAA